MGKRDTSDDVESALLAVQDAGAWRSAPWSERNPPLEVLTRWVRHARRRFPTLVERTSANPAVALAVLAELARFKTPVPGAAAFLSERLVDKETASKAADTAAAGAHRGWDLEAARPGLTQALKVRKTAAKPPHQISRCVAFASAEALVRQALRTDDWEAVDAVLAHGNPAARRGGAAVLVSAARQAPGPARDRLATLLGDRAEEVRRVVGDWLVGTDAVNDPRIRERLEERWDCLVCGPIPDGSEALSGRHRILAAQLRPPLKKPRGLAVDSSHETETACPACGTRFRWIYSLTQWGDFQPPHESEKLTRVTG